MTASYAGIRSEALYYVPLGKTYEVWGLTVTNESSESRELTLTGYGEFTNHSNYEQDQVNLQYSLFITRTLFRIIPLFSRYTETWMLSRRTGL